MWGVDDKECAWDVNKDDAQVGDGVAWLKFGGTGKGEVCVEGRWGNG